MGLMSNGNKEKVLLLGCGITGIATLLALQKITTPRSDGRQHGQRVDPKLRPRSLSRSRPNSSRSRPRANIPVASRVGNQASHSEDRATSGSLTINSLTQHRQSQASLSPIQNRLSSPPNATAETVCANGSRTHSSRNVRVSDSPRPHSPHVDVMMAQRTTPMERDLMGKATLAGDDSIARDKEIQASADPSRPLVPTPQPDCATVSAGGGLRHDLAKDAPLPKGVVGFTAVSPRTPCTKGDLFANLSPINPKDSVNNTQLSLTALDLTPCRQSSTNVRSDGSPNSPSANRLPSYLVEEAEKQISVLLAEVTLSPSSPLPWVSLYQYLTDLPRSARVHLRESKCFLLPKPVTEGVCKDISSSGLGLLVRAVDALLGGEEDPTDGHFELNDGRAELVPRAAVGTASLRLADSPSTVSLSKLCGMARKPVDQLEAVVKKNLFLLVQGTSTQTESSDPKMRTSASQTENTIMMENRVPPSYVADDANGECAPSAVNALAGVLHAFLEMQESDDFVSLRQTPKHALFSSKFRELAGAAQEALDRIRTPNEPSSAMTVTNCKPVNDVEKGGFAENTSRGSALSSVEPYEESSDALSAKLAPREESQVSRASICTQSRLPRPVKPSLHSHLRRLSATSTPSGSPSKPQKSTAPGHRESRGSPLMNNSPPSLQGTRDTILSEHGDHSEETVGESPIRPSAKMEESGWQAKPPLDIYA